ncbi:glycosyltransferase [Thalassomonas sp. M1454]|uniref:glycosyltransferase n=1 Tax=Thalassomonas sp. M1454 TaxID=2594477 RepID=UPI00117C11B8|nr:glycosyltransferase [Thalassomonas sp. M1454]TRX57190.1 glycosyltransferase [Thalassomonas sp. M1454]
MKNNPTIVVLLAAYNGEKYIEEQIKTIYAQERVELTLVVNLDLSSDNSLNKLEKFASDNSINILPYGQRFGSAGANFFYMMQSVDFSKYDFVALADQDDIWNTSKLIDGINYLRYENADGYSSSVTAFWENGRKTLLRKNQPQKEFDYLFESPGPGCTFIFTKKLAIAIQDELIIKKDKVGILWMHDWFFYSFARFNKFKWAIDGRSSMLYRQHGNNEVGANSGWKSFYQRLKVVTKGDAFKNLIIQADFLRQHNLPPIKLIKNNSRFSFFKLAFYAKSCRRKPFHQFLFLCMCLIFFVKGGHSYEDS